MKVREDEFVVRHLAGLDEAPLGPIGFHAQQAIE
jgi:hypothetical protein